MMYKRKNVLLGLLSIFMLISCKAQSGNDWEKLTFPKEKQLPEKFLNTIKELQESYYRVYKEDTARIKNYSKKFILSKIDTSKDFAYIREAEYWLAFNYKKGIPNLIKMITKNREVGLENYLGLIIILERVDSGEMNVGQHGSIIDDDLFKVSGRANYLLKEFTGQDFGDVTMDSTQEELEILQQKWIEWLKGLGD